MSNKSSPNTRVLQLAGEEPPEAPQHQRQVAQDDSFGSSASHCAGSSSQNEASSSSPTSSYSFSYDDEGSPIVRPLDRALVGEEDQQERDRSPPKANSSNNSLSDRSHLVSIRNLNREKAREILRPSIIQELPEETDEELLRGVRRSNNDNSARPSIQRGSSSGAGRDRGGRAVYKRQQSDISGSSFASEGDERGETQGSESCPIQSISTNDGRPFSTDAEVSHNMHRRTPQATSAAAAARIAATQQRQQLLREASIRRVTPPSSRHVSRKGTTGSNQSSDSGNEHNMSNPAPSSLANLHHGGPIHPYPQPLQFDPQVELPPTPSGFVARGGGSFDYGRSESPRTPLRKISAVRSFTSPSKIDEAPVGIGIGSPIPSGDTDGLITVDEEETSDVRQVPQAAASATAARIAAKRQDKFFLMAHQLQQKQQEQQLMRETMMRRVPRRRSTESNLGSYRGAFQNLDNPSSPSLPFRLPGGPIRPPLQQRQFYPPDEMPLTSASFDTSDTAFNYGRSETPRTPHRELAIYNNMMGGSRGISERNLMVGGGPGSNISQREGGYNAPQRRLSKQGMGGGPRPAGPMMQSQSQHDPMINSSHSSGGYGPRPTGPMMRSQRDPMINSSHSSGSYGPRPTGPMMRSQSLHSSHSSGSYGPRPTGPMMRSQSQRDPMINSSHSSGGYGPDPSVGPDILSRYKYPEVGSLEGTPECSLLQGTGRTHPQSATQYQPLAPVHQHQRLPPPPLPHNPVPQYSQRAMHPRPVEKKIEIAPNIWARLRGADETWACIENDYFMPAQCFGCDLELCCIQDAEYVLCPECRVVSPMNGIDDTNSNMMRNGGVGLGFTFEDLRKWQSEIVMARQQARQRYGRVYAA